MIQSRRKAGMITTEVAIGIGLAVVVLFVAIGLFNENISAMVLNSSLAKFFNSGEKTTYSSLNRDYSASQVNVQIMGEQGLGMLRQRANNKSIDIINQDFSSGNTDGSSIAYLALSIQVLAGEPHTCVYMKKDSNKPCNQDDIGGYNYRIDVNSSTITIGKVTDKESVSSVGKSVTLNVDPGVLSAFNNAINSAGTTAVDSQNLTAAQKYQILSDTSEALDPLGPKAYKHVRSDAILIRKTKFNQLGFISANKNKSLKSDIEDFITLVIEYAKASNTIYDKCGGFYRFAHPILCTKARADVHIDDGEIKGLITWEKDLISSLDSLVNPTDQQVADIFNKNLLKSVYDGKNNRNLFDILNDDNAYDSITSKTFAAKLYKMCIDRKKPLSFLSVQETSDQYGVGDMNGENHCSVNKSEVSQFY